MKNNEVNLEKVMAEAKAKVAEIELITWLVERLHSKKEDDWDLVQWVTEPTGEMVPKQRWNREAQKYEDVINPETGEVEMEEKTTGHYEPRPEETLTSEAKAKLLAYEILERELLDLAR